MERHAPAGTAIRATRRAAWTERTRRTRTRTSRIAAVAADWVSAVVSNSPERIAEFMAEEWVMVSDEGVSSRERFLSCVTSGDLTHSAMDVVQGPRVRVYGDAATFTTRVTNTAHYRGRRFDADEWTTDVFVSAADGGCAS